MVENFGFIHEKLEIKILILFILRRLSNPITQEALAQLAMCDDGISYFDFCECVADLVKTEHIRLEDNKYILTDKGARNGEITENSLPMSIRTKADTATSAARAQQLRNALIKTSHTVRPDGGLKVMLSMSDGVDVIMSMELFAANERQAAALEKGFRSNAENVYNTLIEKILES